MTFCLLCHWLLWNAGFVFNKNITAIVFKCLIVYYVNKSSFWTLNPIFCTTTTMCTIFRSFLQHCTYFLLFGRIVVHTKYRSQMGYFNFHLLCWCQFWQLVNKQKPINHIVYVNKIKIYRWKLTFAESVFQMLTAVWMGDDVVKNLFYFCESYINDNKRNSNKTCWSRVVYHHLFSCKWFCTPPSTFLYVAVPSVVVVLPLFLGHV